MIVLIAGASGGLGRVLAEMLAEGGDTVYGTARRVDAEASGSGVTMLPMEITDDASVEACIAEIVSREGRLDAVVNCVNRMVLGSVEEQTVDEVRRVYEVDVFGALRLNQAALPQMRRQGSGALVVMSSIGGILAVPHMSAYTSAKFALEAMAESLYHELRDAPIDVVIMQPVAMKMDRDATGEHLSVVERVEPDSRTHRIVEMMDRDTAESGLTPEAVATKIRDVLHASSRPLRVRMDRARPLSVVKRLAPQAMIDRMIDGILPD